jgi:hypothetical protein
LVPPRGHHFFFVVEELEEVVEAVQDRISVYGNNQ